VTRSHVVYARMTALVPERTLHRVLTHTAQQCHAALADIHPELCGRSNRLMEQPLGETGVAAYMEKRRKPLGGGLVPGVVIHVRLGLRWQVREVLDAWEHPLGVKAPSGAVHETWRLRVVGPLPGRSSESGEFVMVVKSYADRPYWWIAPGTP
jgi:hypothetical protein